MQSSHLKNKDIIAATDECVMCGLCLPHCPTYSITKNEAESPRGRIALVRALHESELLPSPVLIDHLDQCVACMNCVSVCPVNIEYAKILEAGRDITNQQHALLHRMKQTLLLATLSKASMRRFIKVLLLIYHALRIDSFFRILAARFPYRLRILSLIPRPDKARFPSRPLLGHTQDLRVALVESCAGNIFSDSALPAAKAVLQALGFEITRLPQTRCCGALHQHGGCSNTARKLIQEFCDSFKKQNIDVLVSLTTGCAAHINRYPEILNHPFTAELVNNHTDISSFVVEHMEKQVLKFRPLPQKVFIHEPCTQKQIGNITQVVERLLNVIPDIQLETFQDDLACCGAGGVNMLFHDEHADCLIQNKITEIANSDATYLVTPNIGCAMHFQAQLSKINAPVVVCHPIHLFAQQLIYSKHAELQHP